MNPMRINCIECGRPVLGGKGDWWHEAPGGGYGEILGEDGHLAYGGIRMSADNWAECPRCIFNDRYEVANLEHKLNESYGNVPIQDYEALRTQIDELQYEQENNPRRETFREDYEFYGAETGTLQIRYSGCCTKCGLKLSFEEERDFYKEGRSG